MRPRLPSGGVRSADHAACAGMVPDQEGNVTRGRAGCVPAGAENARAAWVRVIEYHPHTGRMIG